MFIVIFKLLMINSSCEQKIGQSPGHHYEMANNSSYLIEKTRIKVIYPTIYILIPYSIVQCNLKLTAT